MPLASPGKLNVCWEWSGGTWGDWPPADGYHGTQWSFHAYSYLEARESNQPLADGDRGRTGTKQLGIWPS